MSERRLGSSVSGVVELLKVSGCAEEVVEDGGVSVRLSGRCGSADVLLLSLVGFDVKSAASISSVPSSSRRQRPRQGRRGFLAAADIASAAPATYVHLC